MPNLFSFIKPTATTPSTPAPTADTQVIVVDSLTAFAQAEQACTPTHAPAQAPADPVLPVDAIDPTTLLPMPAADPSDPPLPSFEQLYREEQSRQVRTQLAFHHALFGVHEPSLSEGQRQFEAELQTSAPNPVQSVTPIVSEEREAETEVKRVTRARVAEERKQRIDACKDAIETAELARKERYVELMRGVAKELEPFDAACKAAREALLRERSSTVQELLERARQGK